MENLEWVWMEQLQQMTAILEAPSLHLLSKGLLSPLPAPPQSVKMPNFPKPCKAEIGKHEAE